MVTVLIRCRVADYDFWRPRYNAAVTRDEGRGLLSSQVWRGQDDPNLVVIIETHESRASADALMNNPEIQADMVSDGVDVSSVLLDFLDEDATDAR
jgi:quinol monooxygenase YgiN